MSPASSARAAESEPAVTVTSGITSSACFATSVCRPNGKPISLTGRPASIASESPNGRYGRSAAVICSAARSSSAFEATT